MLGHPCQGLALLGPGASLSSRGTLERRSSQRHCQMADGRGISSEGLGGDTHDRPGLPGWRWPDEGFRQVTEQLLSWEPRTAPLSDGSHCRLVLHPNHEPDRQVLPWGRAHTLDLSAWASWRPLSDLGPAGQLLLHSQGHHGQRKGQNPHPLLEPLRAPQKFTQKQAQSNG